MVKKRRRTSSTSSGVSREELKERLTRMKEKYNIKYSKAPKEYKKIGMRLAGEQERKEKEERGIKKLQKKIKEKGFLGRLSKGISRAVSKKLKKKVVSRKIIKPSRMTVRIQEREPAPYINRYFQDELKEAKKNFFFD